MVHVRCDRRWTTIVSLGAILGCADGAPYDMALVSGTVKYSDGSLIPADAISLRFDPEAAPIDAKTHPRKGFADVDVTDGSFGLATTHKYGDGLVAGKHRVLVRVETKNKSPTSLVGKEYLDPSTTPVEIDTAQLPLDIRIEKPIGR